MNSSSCFVGASMPRILPRTMPVHGFSLSALKTLLFHSAGHLPPVGTLFLVMIIGADPDTSTERPLFEIVSAPRDKLRASRHVLSEHGNMSSAIMMFVLDEIRKKRPLPVKVASGVSCWGLRHTRNQSHTEKRQEIYVVRQ
ncbi:hypothetical protein CsSME_00001679 [Camellia sinensis var. sinensis]